MDINEAGQVQRQKAREAKGLKVSIIRGATLTPRWRSTTAAFNVDPQIETNFGDKDGHMYRVSEVHAEVTHYAADRHEEPAWTVKCWGRKLTATGELDRRELPYWIPLPAELAQELLDRDPTT